MALDDDGNPLPSVSDGDLPPAQHWYIEVLATDGEPMRFVAIGHGFEDTSN